MLVQIEEEFVIFFRCESLLHSIQLVGIIYVNSVTSRSKICLRATKFLFTVLVERWKFTVLEAN